MIDVGGTVGNYRVIQQIGGGAMGRVFLGEHPVIGKRVALKVIHPELASNEEMISRFFNEARAVTQIGHENIVDVQDFGQTPDGDSFIVMELLEGRGLGDTMKADGIFSVPRATHIALQIADGLAAAHALGIIHRDLKPDNVILISRGGDPDFVKILDFGLAKLSQPGAMQHKTKTGSLLGTPHYMAPEQAEGKKIDHRVDVYALGCILFQMLTGRVPFPGTGFGEVLVKHVREPPPLPSRLNAEVPPAIEKIVLHALAKRPEFRFASMDEFRAALRDPERFAQKLDSADALRLTPGDPVPAPELKPDARPRQITLPPDAPMRLPENAPTVQGQAPPEVQALLAQRTAQAKRPALEIATAPGTTRSPAATVAEPIRRARPAKRASGMLIGLLGGLALFAVAGGTYLVLHARGGSVTIAIDTAPTGAEVARDGHLLGIAPLVVALPKGSDPIELTFRKPGYLLAQRAITPAADQQLNLRLLPVPAPEPVAAPAPAPVAAPTPAPAPAHAVAPARENHPAPAARGGGSAPDRPQPTAADSTAPAKPAPRHHHREHPAQPKPDPNKPILLTPSF